MHEGTRRAYDAVAADYAAAVGDELIGKPIDRALLAAFVELSDSGAVVDLGCGPGHVTAALSALGAVACGMDLSPAMCALARRANGLRYCAADLTALPIRSGALAGVVCLYTVIHLDETARAAAYREFARVLQPGGNLMIAFHTSSADTVAGEAMTIDTWWGHEVDLTFRYLVPDAEVQAVQAAGLSIMARLDRAPHVGVEHESNRSYVLARRPTA